MTSPAYKSDLVAKNSQLLHMTLDEEKLYIKIV
jgi:hypothetical protein